MCGAASITNATSSRRKEAGWRSLTMTGTAGSTFNHGENRAILASQSQPETHHPRRPRNRGDFGPDDEIGGNFGTLPASPSGTGDVLAYPGRDEETPVWPISKVEGVDLVFTEY